MKKIFTIVVIMLFSLMAFGCSMTTLPSNSFSLKSIVLANGGVRQEIEFPTLKSFLDGYDQNKINDYLQKLQTEIEEKVYNSFYLNYWLKYMENQNTEFIIGGDKVKFERPALSADQNSISFSLGFLTRDAWEYYTKQNEEDEEGSEEFKNIFMTKTESEGQFPFTEEIAEQYLSVVNSTVKAYFPNLTISKSDIHFSYVYQTPYQKIKSNADVKGENKEGVYHIWTKSKEEIKEEKPIVIWVNEVNKGVWYLLILGTTLFLSLIILLIYYLRKKKDKKLLTVPKKG